MALQLDLINYNLQFAITILSFIIITVISQLFKKQLRCKSTLHEDKSKYRNQL
jgi:hypothetical protein